MRVAFELIDEDMSGTLEANEFVDMVGRLMHPVATADLLVMKRNLDKLCEHNGVTDCLFYNASKTDESDAVRRGSAANIFPHSKENRANGKDVAIHAQAYLAS